MRVAGVGDRGFTLVEALVAMTLAMVVVSLVSSVFLAQNNFYGEVVRRSTAHDGVRSVLDLGSADVRSASPNGIILADSLRFAFRTPLSVGMVCDIQGNRADAYLPYGSAALDTGNVSGYGIRGSDGTWTYYPSAWRTLFSRSDRTVAASCADQGMDTVGAPVSHFMQLSGPGSDPSPRPSVGTGIMLYRSLELRVDDSALNTGTSALFRGTYDGTLLEFASGLGDRTHFEYRLQGENGYAAEVSAGNLSSINSVRVVAHAISDREVSSGLYEYEISQDVPLHNAR